MSKRDRGRDPSRVPAVTVPSGTDRGPWVLAVVALAAAAILAVGTLGSWRQARRDREAIGARVAALENRVTELSSKIDAVAKAATPPRRGPDPNKVYPIRTDGAPVRGPATAPVTIALFSDFQ
jgi:hypothetical protein